VSSGDLSLASRVSPASPESWPIPKAEIQSFRKAVLCDRILPGSPALRVAVEDFSRLMGRQTVLRQQTRKTSCKRSSTGEQPVLFAIVVDACALDPTPSPDLMAPSAYSVLPTSSRTPRNANVRRDRADARICRLVSKAFPRRRARSPLNGLIATSFVYLGPSAARTAANERRLDFPQDRRARIFPATLNNGPLHF